MKTVNPLDQFNSHSVHYTVLACRTTEDIRAFTDQSDRAQAESLQAIDACKTLGGEVRLRNANGKVFLMLDTRRFSQFTIENFSMDTLISGFTVPGSRSPHNAAVAMSFNVIDNVGISFANFLQYLMDRKLQVSFNGMTLLVRILFVGHLADGTSKTVQSVTIPAIFDKIQVDLNDTRGVYACTLHPMIGMPSNAGYNAKWTSIGTASSYFTGAGANTLGAMVKSFEENLNAESLKRYGELNAVTQTSGQKDTTVGNFGRPVQYMITLPGDGDPTSEGGWAGFEFNGPTQHSAVETVFKQLVAAETQKATTAAEAQKKAQANANSPAKDAYVAVNPNLTITEVLDVIFSQTAKVAELGNFTKKQDQQGNLKYYKHLVTVTSDDSSFTVHIDVVEYLVPNVALNETATNQASAQSRDTQLFMYVNEAGQEVKDARHATKKLPRNFIELDYIFSGKNLDVLHLDLKIENLNWLLLRGVKLGASVLNSVSDAGQKSEDGDGVGQDTRTVQGMKAKDPLLIPQRTAAESKNFSNFAANARQTGDATPGELNQQYQRNLSAFYNAGPINAKLELRGNPDLFAQVALTQVPQHVNGLTITAAGGVTSSANTAVKSQYRANFDRNLLRLDGKTPLPRGAVDVRMLTGPSFVSSPVFVKVNVFGPNVDFTTNELIAGQNFSQKLLYDNYYWLSKITSKIDGVKFTQDLELSSYSVYGYSSPVADGGVVNKAQEK
jgi:hypothetical protein